MYLINESFEGTPPIPEQAAANCSPGFWCPATSSSNKEHLCPGGTYGATSNLKLPACSGICKAGCSCPEGSTSACEKPCPAGFFCVEGTGGTAAPPIICPHGYYCPESSPTPIICPEGASCPAGTTSI
uniref:Uncharacterized protein n=1 Tax=viral metagenome TaxID=1070528 RepID=A0A6C0AMW6_9ZZZZ